jgi:hypothetical protein
MRVRSVGISGEVQSVHNRSFGSRTAAERKKLMSDTKADKSGHMLIWVRLPIPDA